MEFNLCYKIPPFLNLRKKGSWELAWVIFGKSKLDAANPYYAKSLFLNLFNIGGKYKF